MQLIFDLVTYEAVLGSCGSEYAGAGRDLPKLDISLKKSSTAGKSWAGCQPFPVVVSQAVVAAVRELPPMGYVNKPTTESRKGHLKTTICRKSCVPLNRP